jgi:hypothetical protein
MVKRDLTGLFFKNKNKKEIDIGDKTLLILNLGSV